MGRSNSNELKKKYSRIFDFIFKDKTVEEYQENICANLVKNGEEIYFATFFTISDTRMRAKVFRGTGLSLQAALDKALQTACDGVNKQNIDPKWVKLEIVIKSEECEPQALVDEIFGSYGYYFRKGLSLDRKYNYAYTEGELNGFKLLDYKRKAIDLRVFNNYSMQRDDDVILSTPKKLYSFVTDQYFCDDKDEVYSLYNEGLDTGRRQNDELTQKEVLRLIQNGVRFLEAQMHPDGTFDYGYYPLNHQLIGGYNIMRHTSSIWSLVCAAELTKDKNAHRLAVSAIKYMLSQIRYYDDGVAYLIEKDAGEIKLGANGVAIILLTQYMNLFDTDEYKDVCTKLGMGILRMLDPETGGFIHVLNADDRSIKDEYRTVYYDGEATFALCRLYSMSGSKLWLTAATRAVDFFIEEDYTKHRDHWVAYAVNELTMHVPKEKYFEFGLKNAMVNLEAIYKQKTTYHTYLELLMATYGTYKRIIDGGYEVKYLEQFDVKRFAETILHRAEHMQNGYGYPEFIMYYKKPSYYKGSFFVRHDAFRTRIDDVQHNCGSYISLYKHYDEIVELANQD